MKTTVLSLLILICSMAVFSHVSLAQDTRPMVRLIYFLPSDREPQPDIDVKMDGLIKDVQQAYANLMEAHGFGRKTFRFEADARGKAVVHHVKGRYTDEHYSNLSWTWNIWEEIDGRFDTSKNIYLTAIDISSETIDSGGACGRGGPEGGVAGKALIPASGFCFNVPVIVHELGHAFGLQHDFRANAKRFLSDTSDWMVTSFCAAEWLDAHRAFNADRSAINELPTIEMLPPSLASPPNAIRFRFKVTDPDGVHQVQLHTPEYDGYNALLGCKRLNGNSNRTVEFVTPYLTPESRSVSLQMIDVNGNLFWSENYPINVTSLLPPPEVVSIPDVNLAAAVRREVGNITTHTMLNLTQLEVPNRRITNLTGLEHAYNLKFLNLGGEYIDGEGYVNSNAVSDFSPLSELSELLNLNLSYSLLSDVLFLSGLTQLAHLYLDGSAITDLTPLAAFTQLTSLSLRGNAIADVSPLAGLTQLTSLDLSNNHISDVSPLAGLTQLTYLSLWDNAIADVSPLAGLTQLTSLDPSNNRISDVSPLAGLTQLTYLSLWGNAIADVSLLAGLTQLTSLDLSNNRISDVSALSELTQLASLDLSNNRISDVSALSELTQLKILNLMSNRITDVSPLVGLNLTEPQWDSSGLRLWDNLLNYASINTHIPAMQARGIEVKFDNRTPTTFVKISGAAQQGVVNAVLPLPFVVEVRDQHNRVFAGVPVTFVVTIGDGRLSATAITTDANGRAQAQLTFGQTAGATTVRVTAADISQPVQFTATALLLSSLVTVPDTHLRTKIVETLNKPRGTTLTASDMLTLTELTANGANIRDLTGLQHAPNLKTLSLDNNNLSDVAPLAALTQLETLSLDNNSLSDVTPLAGLTQLKTLSLASNSLSDVSALEGLPHLKTLHLRGNLLSYPSLHTHILAIQAGGATVTFSSRTPSTISKISDTHGVAGTALWVIIKVYDEDGFEFSGVPVTFSVTAGGGRLSPLHAITDGTGRAWTTLTLGSTPGRNTVRVVAAEAPRPVNFTITAIDADSRVTIRDAALRAKMVDTLGKASNATITAADMLALKRLEVPNANIQNLTGLEHAHNLVALNLGREYIAGEGYLNSNEVSDFSPLFGLTQLATLNLSYSSLSDVSFLSELTQLKDLYLEDNNISDVSPLSKLTQLTSLNFYNNTISDVSPLANLTQLTHLDLYKNTISDVSPLANLIQLPSLRLGANTISDVSPLANLTQLTRLDLAHNAISDVSPLANLTRLTHLNLYNNAVSDVLPLAELNLTGGQWDSIGLYLELNPLNYVSLHTHIPAIQAKGIEVKFDQRTYPALDIISGSGQQATGSESLANPLVVAAIDAGGTPIRGISVTFTVIGGHGELSTTTAATDARGRAQTTLTLGPNPGRHRAQATAAALNSRILFIAIATAPVARLAADVNGDGVVNIQDLVIVSSHLGQDGQNGADVNGDGAINIQDLVLVAGELGTEAAAPSAWHRTSGSVPPRATVEQWLAQAYHLSLTDVRSQRGVFLLERLLAALAPKETALLTNYPNPSNPETWIPYQLAEPADVTLHIYSVNGALVRTLELGHQIAGMYHNKTRSAYWDGRNAQGEKVASGIYFYTLSAGDFSATRKLLIRK